MTETAVDRPVWSAIGAETEPEPDQIVAAVLGCPAVAGMDGGRFGDVVSYLPRRRVAGVAVRPGRIIVSVLGRPSATATMLKIQITAAVAPLGHGCTVDVIFADIAIGTVGVPAAI